MDQDEVFQVIREERHYQDVRWGDNPHEVGAWITIMRHLVDKAAAAWIRDSSGYNTALDEIRKLAAVAVACAEQHGLPTRVLVKEHQKER